MAWSGSAMFRAFVQYNLLKDDGVTLGNYGTLETDTLKVALFDTDVTPNKDAAITATGYNTGVWVSTDEVADNPNWDTAGEPLTGKAFSTGAGFAMFDATDTPQSGASTTLSGVHGCLVYDDSTTAGTNGVADQGVTYHWFGGAQSVTAGSFTIVWHANGLFRITV